MANKMNVAQHLFVINKQLQGLRSITTASSVSTTATSVSQQAIVDAICFPSEGASIKLREQIMTSLPLYKRYKECLILLKVKRSALQAVASDGKDLLQRKGDGFSLRIKLDQDIPQQAYALLDISVSTMQESSQGLSQQNTESNYAPCYLHCDLHNTFSLITFTQGRSIPTGSRYQLLLDVQSTQYKQLCDPQSELFLSY